MSKSKLDKLGRCKHCSATILSGYDSCSDCTARLEFERMKIAATEVRKHLVEKMKAEERERAKIAEVEKRKGWLRGGLTKERQRELKVELKLELEIARRPSVKAGAGA